MLVNIEAAERSGSKLLFRYAGVLFFAKNGLPKGMALADLGHKSIRRNALIADLLHRIGFIEKAGTGIRRIRDEARASGYPEPRFAETGFLTATFFPNPEVRALAEAPLGARSTEPVTEEVAAGVTEQDTEQVTEQVVRLVQALRESALSSQELLDRLGLSHRPTLLYQYLQPSLRAGLVEMTIPDKPRSSKQRYRLTSKGRARVKEHSEEESRATREVKKGDV